MNWIFLFQGPHTSGEQFAVKSSPPSSITFTSTFTLTFFFKERIVLASSLPRRPRLLPLSLSLSLSFQISLLLSLSRSAYFWRAVCCEGLASFLYDFHSHFKFHSHVHCHTFTITFTFKERLFLAGSLLRRPGLFPLCAHRLPRRGNCCWRYLRSSLDQVMITNYVHLTLPTSYLMCFLANIIRYTTPTRPQRWLQDKRTMILSILFWSKLSNAIQNVMVFLLLRNLVSFWKSWIWNHRRIDNHVWIRNENWAKNQ